MLIAKFLWAVISLLLSNMAESQVNQTSAIYTVLAPLKIRPHMAYQVSATAHNISSPLEMTISVEGPTDNGTYNSISKITTLNSGETQIIKLDIGEWSQGNYSLVATGKGGIDFRNQTTLLYEQKSFSVFIQTDKAIYKPGQLVQFRVLVVDSYLLPAVIGTISVFITDAKGNRIKQWNRTFTSKGILSKELLLSDQPILGNWTIHADVLGQIYKKDFTVAEYVLPTFDVKINLPSYATYNNSDIVATVTSMYTYGKPVKGKVTVSASHLPKYGFVSISRSSEIKMKIDGSVDVPMNLVKDLTLKADLVVQEVKISATVEEDLTGRKYNTSSIINVYNTDIKIELIKTSKTFKPGLKYTALLKVVHQDDTPLKRTADKVKLSYGYTYNDENWESMELPVPPNGMTELEFFPPQDKELSFLSMSADFRGMQFHLDSTDAAISPSYNFLQILMITQNPKINEDIELEVNATEPLTHLIYEVLSRGDILSAQTIQVPNTTTHRFTFPTDFRMAPKARVLVYYIRSENNEIVADSINFDISGVFRTSVQLDVSTNSTKPGGIVDIMVKTTPHAFVGVLGVDQSSYLLKSGNDITQEDVINEIQSYDGGRKKKFWAAQYRKKRSLWWGPGSTTAGEVFEDSGVVIMTNGLLHHFVQLVMYRSFEYEEYRETKAPMEAKEKDTSIRVRKHFPETWLWNGTLADNEGNVIISTAAPDSITSWIISSFAMDSMTGLGLPPDTAKVTVFRPFFVKLNLPYSVIRGESVAIQAVIFNYNNKPIKADVILDNEKGEFEFFTSKNEVSASDKKQKKKVVEVMPQDGTTVSFLITPLKLGYIELNVKATSLLARDAVLKKLLVKPEGSTQYFNKAMLIDLRHPNSKSTRANITIPIPHDAVEGSERVTLSAIGDLMGPGINNLHQLLRMPYGCGEQNMVNFVPNIVITQYLERANRLTKIIKDESLKFMESGYQRELTYKREDGSFSAFGNKDKSGSTWLTAFVVRSFHQAKPYIDIDDKVIATALQWLVKRQKVDGSFEEPGEVHHKAMQGGSGRGAALTAYVLLAFLENQAQDKYTNEMKLALQYLRDELQISSDPYVISVVTYALHLADHENKEDAFEKLVSLSTKDGDMVYWSKSDKLPQSHVTYHTPKSQDIEMTAYALLTYSIKADIAGALPIMKWLISQQNENGGYASTQDTVIGIQALATMAVRLVSPTISIEIQYSSGQESNSFSITSDTAMVLQKIQLPSSTQYIDLKATGYGVGVVQVSWAYNVKMAEKIPAFSLKPVQNKASTDNYLFLDVCTNYNEEGSSNMAVMEVALPSGYQADMEMFNTIRKVKRVETQEGDTNVVIYFDNIDKEELCVTVPAYQSFKVANKKPVPVKVYDYYNAVKSARAFYEPMQVTVCSICDDDEECSLCNETTITDDKGTGSGVAVTSYSLLLIMTVIVGFRSCCTGKL